MVLKIHQMRLVIETWDNITLFMTNMLYLPFYLYDTGIPCSPYINLRVFDLMQKTELDKKMNSNLEQLMKKITVMESSLKECTQEVSHLKSLLEANNEITTR